MSDTDRHPIFPEPHMLRSQIDGMKDIGWDTALGDMLDNSLDAGASRVEIEMDSRGKIVSITDDGTGCVELWRMFQSGYTTKDGKRGVLGRYGVGFKTVSQYLCGWDGLTSVWSRAEGSVRETTNRWRDVHDTGWTAAPQHPISDPLRVAEVLPWGKGTRVEFSKCHRQFPNQKTLPSLLARLSFWFAPALRSSRSIVAIHNGTTHRLEASQDPSMDEVIHDTIHVGAKSVRITVGMRSPGSDPKMYGLNYCYGHRVIAQNSSAGCGDYQIHGIFGWVHLDDSWKLAADKTCVTDQEGDKLYDAIYRRIEPLLFRASQRADEVRSFALAIDIGNIINDVHGASSGDRGRQRRKPGDTHGTHTSKAGGNRPVLADEVSGQGKDKKKAKTMPALSIKWALEDPDGKGRAAWVDIPNTTSVQVNLSIPAIADAHKRDDRPFLTTLAVATFYNFLTQKNALGRQTIPFAEGKTFNELMGWFLSQPFQYDVSTVKAPRVV